MSNNTKQTSTNPSQPAPHGQASSAAGGAGQPGNAAAGSTTPGGSSRPRIVLPSFKQVAASQKPSAPPSRFTPGALFSKISSQQQQQQQQQQQPNQQHHPASNSIAGGSGAASSSAAAGGTGSSSSYWPPQQGHAAAAAAGGAPAARGLSLGLLRYNQAAGGAASAAAAAAPPFQQPGSQQQQQMPPPPRPLQPQEPSGLQAASPAAAAAAAAAVAGAAAAAAAPAALGPVPGPGAAVGGSGLGTAGSGSAPPINAVLVSQRQQGNPLLKQLRGVRWAFADVAADYQCGANTAVLFLSLRYHLLQPEYIIHRLKALQRAFRLCVVLLLVDTEEVTKPLLELHKITLGADAVLICAWSNEECARYIETLKGYEARPAASIKERGDTDYLGRLTAALSSVRGINRSDAFMLASRFGSLAEVMVAGQQEFAGLPGLGPVKARRLFEAFNQPFKKTLGTTIPAAAAAPGAAGAAAGAAAGTSQQPPGEAAAAAAGEAGDAMAVDGGGTGAAAGGDEAAAGDDAGGGGGSDDGEEVWFDDDVDGEEAEEDAPGDEQQDDAAATAADSDDTAGAAAAGARTMGWQPRQQRAAMPAQLIEADFFDDGDDGFFADDEF